MTGPKIKLPIENEILLQRSYHIRSKAAALLKLLAQREGRRIWAVLSDAIEEYAEQRGIALEGPGDA